MQDVLLPVPRPGGLAMRVVGGVFRHRRSIAGEKKVLFPAEGTGSWFPVPANDPATPKARGQGPVIKGPSSRAQRGICFCSPNRPLAAPGMTVRNAAGSHLPV